MASSSPVLKKIKPSSPVSFLAVVHQSLAARNFSTLHLIGDIYLILLYSSWFIITEHIFCLLPSLLISGVQLHCDVILSFCFPVQTLLQEWGKYITNQLTPELTVSQLDDWVVQLGDSWVLYQKWPNVLVETLSHLLLCVLQKHTAKTYSPNCGIHSGKEAEGINLLSLLKWKT